MKPTLLFACLASLLLGACSAQPATPQLSAEERQAVEAYLVQGVGISAFGGQVFCPFEVLDQDAARLYVWTLCMEYRLVDGKLDMGTGSSLPVALAIERQGESLQVTNHQTSPEGWSEDALAKTFPPAIIERFCMQDPDCHNARAARLEQEAEQAARAFYHLTP